MTPPARLISAATRNEPFPAAVRIGRKWANIASCVPDSLDVYTTQRPSGENRACMVLASLWRYGKGLRSPFMGSTRRAVVAAVAYIRYLPSADQSWEFLLSGD